MNRSVFAHDALSLMECQSVRDRSTKRLRCVAVKARSRAKRTRDRGLGEEGEARPAQARSTEALKTMGLQAAVGALRGG